MAVIFPRWMNRIGPVLAIGGSIGLVFAVSLVWYFFSPWYTDVGYQPKQPVAFSHKTHVAELAMDCRYCHSTVERAAKAAIPPTQTCMGCHERLILPKSVALAALRAAWKTGRPIPWIRVYQLPDYVFFDHSVHIAVGLGCSTCHGRIDKMAVVSTHAPMSMSWCLACHRNPPSKISNISADGSQASYGAQAQRQRTRAVTPPTHCSGCHR